MASPALAPDRTSVHANGETIRFRRETLLWAATALIQILAWVYSQGRLIERVDAQGKQLDRVEQRLNEFTGHK